MAGLQYAEALKFDALREMSRHRHPGGDPIQPYGISTSLLYACIRLQSERQELLQEVDELRTQLQQLKSDLRHTAEERDMLRNGYRVLGVTLAAQSRKHKPASESATSQRRGRRIRAPEWA